MFELTLCLAFERQKYLSEFYKQILPSIKKSDGLVIKHNSNGKSFLSIAVDEIKKEYIKSKVLDFVVEVIENDFKYNFFKEKIDIGVKNNLSEAFIRAISIFDAEIDKEEICEKIEFSNEIVIESLFYFKLQELILRWNSTAQIINQNLIMNNSTAISEVLRYLCAVSENNSVFIDLSFTEKQVELKNFIYHKKFKLDFDGISNLFVEIIKLNPMKINICEKETTDELLMIKSTLLKVFNEKIYFV